MARIPAADKPETFSKKLRHKDARGERSVVAPGLNISALSRLMVMNRGHVSRVVGGKIPAGYEFLKRLRGVLKLKSVEDAAEWLKRLKEKVA